MIDTLLNYLGTTSEHTIYFLAFVVAFVESLPVIGIVFPGIIVVVFLGFLASNGNDISFWMIAFFVNFGFIVGECISYIIGRYNLHHILLSHFSLFNTERLDSCRQFFKKHGGKSILVGRFVGVVRPFISLTAGLSYMPIWRFLFYTVVSTFLWSILYLIIGYTVGINTYLLNNLTTVFSVIALVCVVSGLFCYYVMRSKYWCEYIVNLQRICKKCFVNKYFFISFILGVLSISWTMLKINGLLVDVDTDLLFLARSLHNETLTLLIIIITELGSFKIGVLVMLILSGYLYLKHKSLVSIIYTNVFFIVMCLLNSFIKIFFDISRPPLENRLVSAISYSFPSGHALVSMVVYGLMAYFLIHSLENGYLKIFVLSIFSVLILLIGFSRVYLQVHWPSDIIGGYLLGATGLYFFWGVLRKFSN